MTSAAPSFPWESAPEIEADWTLLQPLLTPAEGLPPQLYLALSPNPALPPHSLPIAMMRGMVLSTDTYFGSFYRAWWSEIAGLSRFALAVTLSGKARLQVFEETDAGRHPILDQDLAAGEARRFMLPLPLAPCAKGAASRLHLTLEARGDVTLAAVDFLTDRPPLRQTRLSVGLCSFNQEAHLTAILQRLLALADVEPRLARIHLVNQGAPFAAPALLALLGDPRLRVVAQRNLGGAGGFTRGLMEEMAEATPASHHLLMDDDILLDARLIGRALCFLDHAQPEIALGAGMFDKARPGLMYEAGAFLLPQNQIQAHGRDADLTDPAALSLFAALVNTDFNAWWFCILPLAAVARAGLPAPIFIRGDDFEYGQRLAAAGVPTITLPGLGVWHEPFDARPTSWQDYYDLRNRLIFAASAPGRVRQLSLAAVLGLILTGILTHNYPSARLRMQAARDYLDGPGPTLADAEALHRRIMALARQDAPETLDDAARSLPLAAPGRLVPQRIRTKALQMGLALVLGGALPPWRQEIVLTAREATPLRVAGRSYLRTNDRRGYHQRFVPRLGLMWALLGQTAALAWRFRREIRAADTAWTRALPAHRRPEWWRAAFDGASPR